MPRQPHGGQGARDDPGRDAAGDGECDDGHVQLDFVDARQDSAGRVDADAVNAGGKPDAEESTDRSEQRRLGEQMPREPSAAGTE